jgi:ABC-type sugar transport system substrate-binding protein
MPRLKLAGVGTIAIVAALMAMAMAGEGAASKNARPLIAYIPPVIANPAIKAMNDAIALKAKSLGMDFATIGGDYNPQAQIVAVDAAIQRKVDAILIWPLDPKGIQPSFDKARKAGVKILAVWSPKVPGIVANFQYDDFTASKKMAMAAAAALKKQGKQCSVGIIEGIPVVDILRNRNLGLAAGAKAGGCTILEHTVNQKDNSDGAQPIAAAWKTKHGSKMTAILAYNDPSALGAVAVAGGDFKPLITGMNGDALGIAAVKSGAMFATGSAPNVEVGNAMAQAAYNTLVSKKFVPREINFPIEILTKANVGAYKPWSVRLKGGAEKIVFVKSGSKWFVKATPDYSSK